VSTAASARSAFERSFHRHVPGPTGVRKPNAGVGLAATAFDLQPAVAAIEALCDPGGADPPYPTIRIDRASASALASRVALAASRAPSHLRP
jgi:hypothetical protein